MLLAGIGIDDILHKDKVDLAKVFISNPVIEVYNKSGGKLQAKDTDSIYQKLTTQFKRISIKEIFVQNGIFINHNIVKNSINKITGITITMHDLLIDSSTQFDKSRFLFAKDAAITIINYRLPTADSLYFVKLGSLNLSTAAHKITLRNILVQPRLTRQQFEARLTTRKYLYNLSVPEIIFSGLDWRQLINRHNFIVQEATVNKGNMNVFLDRSLPFAKVKQNNFLHQLLLRIPIPVNVSKVLLRQLNMVYTEYNPGVAKTGNIYLDNVSGTIFNLTNMPQQIKRDHQMVLQSSGLFMHKVLLRNTFHFDLSKYKTGNFTMALEVGKLDSSILNPITEPMAEFMFKKGVINKGTVNLQGDNYKVSGNGLLLYDDLYLVGLKKNNNEPGKLKKKEILSFIGNLLLIKNSNPSKVYRFSNSVTK
ncbi:MAG TPA: hypothetical protein VGP55_09010 [Chitinophagaceae bacterium]|nr:hypothetical protein [Chitinophagaceae bacterium]